MAVSALKFDRHLGLLRVGQKVPPSSSDTEESERERISRLRNSLGLLPVGQKQPPDSFKSNGCYLKFDDFAMPSKDNLNSYYLEELNKYSNKDIMTEPRKRSKYIHNSSLACKCGEEKSCKKNSEIRKNIVYDSWLICCLKSGLICKRRSKYDALSVCDSSGDYEYNSLWGDAGKPSNVSSSKIPPKFTHSNPFSNSFAVVSYTEFTPSSPFSNSFGHTTN